jgi:cytochrome b pre-mRNA-processing protein 3
MLFAKLFSRSSPEAEVATRLYTRLVEKARDPAFYVSLGVPDTVNGRFDMVVIHAMLVLRRLRGGGTQADQSGKALLELLFRDMDQSLREMGVGDMGIGRHIKRMAKALFGRSEAYEAGLDGAPEGLVSALKENLYRHSTPTDAQVAGLTDYIHRAAAQVDAQTVGDIAAGQLQLDVAVLGVGRND